MMIYEIQTKNDISGVKLLVRFPEEDLDRKALYTLQMSRPPFILPFHYHAVDGNIECIYDVSGYSKLQYRFSSRTPEEYATLWNKLLQPLLECDDWFMAPASFVLALPYVYGSNDGKAISYVYIPSQKAVMDADALKILAVEVAKQNPVTDPILENRVLKAFMGEFHPREFLEILKMNSRSSSNHCPAIPTSPRPITPEPAADCSEPAAEQSVPSPYKAPPQSADSGDIQINLDGGKADREKRIGIFGKKEEAGQRKRGIFGGKKGKVSKDVVISPRPQPPVGVQPAGHPISDSRREAPLAQAPLGESSATQLDAALENPGLRLVGDPELPRIISVSIAPGRAFTIGRFDVSVGRKQSDFEFAPKTKAVSRRHAAIERDAAGDYYIVDLASRAGTFADGVKLLPNAPRRLTQGMRIAFGTGGADYIWDI